MEYQDIVYAEADGVATITIDRPEKMNAFRGQTCEELIHAFHRAGWNKDIGVIVLTGAGDRAFCTGGEQSAGSRRYARLASSFTSTQKSQLPGLYTASNVCGDQLK